MELSYTVGDIKRMINEMQNESSPKLGDGVTRIEKTENANAYKEAEKRAKNFDGGLKDTKREKLPAKNDGNRTTLSYNPSIAIDDKKKKDIEAQAQGYTSALEKNNGIEHAAGMDDEGRIYKSFKEEDDELNKKREDFAKSGLQAREYTKEHPDSVKRNTLHEKKLTFKNAVFIDESKMRSMIPEKYIVDGQKLIMRDSQANEYVVECVESKVTGNVEVMVKGHSNLLKENEEVNRIKALMGFSNMANTSLSNKEKLNESDSFGKIMDLARGVTK